MTLARGGSTLGGDISSFDENLTLPGEGGGCGTPIQMSTDVKKKNPRIDDDDDEREAGRMTPSPFSIGASSCDDFGDSTEAIKEPGEEGKKGEREAHDAGKEEADEDEEEAEEEKNTKEMGVEMTEAVGKGVSGASDASVFVASKALTEDVAATKPFPGNEWTDKFRNVLTQIVSKPPEEN